MKHETLLQRHSACFCACVRQWVLHTPLRMFKAGACESVKIEGVPSSGSLVAEEALGASVSTLIGPSSCSLDRKTVLCCDRALVVALLSFMSSRASLLLTSSDPSTALTEITRKATFELSTGRSLETGGEHRNGGAALSCVSPKLAVRHRHCKR